MSNEFSSVYSSFAFFHLKSMTAYSLINGIIKSIYRHLCIYVTYRDWLPCEEAFPGEDGFSLFQKSLSVALNAELRPHKTP